MDERLINGVSEYVKREVMPNISDAGTKIVISTAIAAVKRDPSVLPALEMINETWIDALMESVKEYGSVSITIPKIPLISPAESKLTFTASDLERLKQYI